MENMLSLVIQYWPWPIVAVLVIFIFHDPTFNYQTGMPSTSFKESMLRLQSSGLVRLLNPEDPGTDLRHSITPLGRRVRSLLVSTCTTLLQRGS
jgi:hypothetical protein